MKSEKYQPAFGRAEKSLNKFKMSRIQRGTDGGKKTFPHRITMEKAVRELRTKTANEFLRAIMSFGAKHFLLFCI